MCALAGHCWEGRGTGRRFVPVSQRNGRAPGPRYGGWDRAGQRVGRAGRDHAGSLGGSGMAPPGIRGLRREGRPYGASGIGGGRRLVGRGFRTVDVARAGVPRACSALGIGGRLRARGGAGRRVLSGQKLREHATQRRDDERDEAGELCFGVSGSEHREPFSNRRAGSQTNSWPFVGQSSANPLLRHREPAAIARVGRRGARPAGGAGGRGRRRLRHCRVAVARCVPARRPGRESGRWIGSGPPAPARAGNRQC